MPLSRKTVFGIANMGYNSLKPSRTSNKVSAISTSLLILGALVVNLEIAQSLTPGFTISVYKGVYTARNTNTGVIAFQSTSASTVFQDSINALKSTNGGVITVSTGTYIFYHTVQILTPNTVIAGKGAAYTLIDTRVPDNIYPDADGAAFNIAASSVSIQYLTISGLYSDPNVSNPALIVAFAPVSISGMWINNVVFNTLPVGHSTFVAISSLKPSLKITNLDIRNNVFYIGNRLYKPDVTASAFILVGIGVRYANVINNYLNGDPNNSATGVDVWEADYNIRVLSNHMTHTRVGVGVTRTEAGSYISGLNNVAIQSNYIDTTLYDNVLINSGDYIGVTQNCLKNAGQDGVHVTDRVTSSGTIYPSHVSVTYNHILGEKGHAITYLGLPLYKSNSVVYIYGNTASAC
jgi:hypothetical protein